MNEKIGIQRWLAVVFGFIGIIIILEPSGFILDFDLFLPVIGAFVLGFYTVLTRKVSKQTGRKLVFLGCHCWFLYNVNYWTIPLGTTLFKDWGDDFTLYLSTAGHFLIMAYENTEASVLQTYIFPTVVCVDNWNNFFNDKITLSILLGGVWLL